LDEQIFDIVIVGGGPVGLGLAIELGQRGVHCAVVEKYQQPQPVPKGQNLTQRTMEHFHFWGIERELRAARTVPKDFGIGGLTTYGSLLGDYAYDWLQRELVRPYYFTDNERLPQYATEDVLRKRAGELPSVEIFYGWDGVEVDQDADGATAVITERDGGATKKLRGQYLVGCDGSNSVVREQVGVTQTRLDHDKLMVLLVFRSAELHTLLERYPGKSFFNVLHPDLKGYWQFFGRVDLGTTWFFHAPVPAGTTRDNFDFKQLLQTAVGADSTAAFDVEIDHIGFWDLRIAIADSYRKDRVFIAGDAAHSHPPYGGYGINIGFEDAHNLGWKLAAVLKGWGGDDLLDSYDEERRPVFASTAHDFIEKSIENDRDFLAAFDPNRDRKAFEDEWTSRGSGASTEVNSFEPHYEGSPIVWGPRGATSSAKGSHAFTARAGHHLAPQPLSSGRNVFDELNAGLTLLALDADRASIETFKDAAQALQTPLKVIIDSRADGRDRYEAKFILVRPDQFVAWSSEDAPDNAREILQKVLGFV
jgi:4-hydroxyisophthalate hydroxylase